MAKQYASKTAPKPQDSYPAADYGSFRDRKLAVMSPDEAQESAKPTEAEPVRLQARLAGCS